MPIVSVKVRLT